MPTVEEELGIARKASVRRSMRDEMSNCKVLGQTAMEMGKNGAFCYFPLL